MGNTGATTGLAKRVENGILGIFVNERTAFLDLLDEESVLVGASDDAAVGHTTTGTFSVWAIAFAASSALPPPTPASPGKSGKPTTVFKGNIGKLPRSGFRPCPEPAPLVFAAYSERERSGQRTQAESAPKVFLIKR